MGLKQKITRELLKEKIGCQNIFNHYFGDFQFNVAYNSVFRADQKKSTGFYVSKSGSIIYNDLATSEKYDFVHFVMKLYNLNFYNALQRIAIDFGLIKGEVLGEKAIIKPLNNKVNQKPKSVFTVKIKPFTRQDLQYWQQYHISKKELVNNNVYSVDSVTIKDFVIYTEPNELKFAYLFKDSEGNGYFKIYSPFNELWKWSSNTPLNLPFGLDSLTCTGDTLILSKSVKDCLVLRKFLPECIGLQNESSSALKKETVKALQKCYKNIIIWFDADKAGIEAANYYKETYGFRTVTTPLNCYVKLSIKDPSDFIKHFGISIFAQYLQQQKLMKR